MVSLNVYLSVCPSSEQDPVNRDSLVGSRQYTAKQNEATGLTEQATSGWGDPGLDNLTFREEADAMCMAYNQHSLTGSSR